MSWESDNYITRREMVKFLALGSLTIAGANAVVAGLPYILKAAEMPRTRIALAASVDAFMRHESGTAVHAAIASAVVFAVNGLLVFYVFNFDRKIKQDRG